MGYKGNEMPAWARNKFTLFHNERRNYLWKGREE